MMQENHRPGLSRGPSMNDLGLWGQQAAIKIRNRITKAPTAIPSIAALDIETAYT